MTSLYSNGVSVYARGVGLWRWIGEVRADRKIKRLLRDTPPCSLAEARENQFVHVAGRVQIHGGRALEAPLSGRLCAYYSITVTVRVHHELFEERPERSIMVADEDEGIPFALEAHGERAIVDPADAWISSKYDHTDEGLTTDRARALYERLGLHQMTGAGRRVLFQEAILGIGEQIAVYGAGTHEIDPASQAEQGYREGGTLCLRFTGSPKFPLVIRDGLAPA